MAYRRRSYSRRSSYTRGRTSYRTRSRTTRRRTTRRRAAPRTQRIVIQVVGGGSNGIASPVNIGLKTARPVRARF